jgi:hypothetical protein
MRSLCSAPYGADVVLRFEPGDHEVEGAGLDAGS